ncbi:UBP32-like protein [Mya arenaria]|uniref:ubiquitinyl hydrolase 1 n=1 Tax=Mya arenaria TaxID=6604 RepID=A0ABY7E069_MYAAR|nr:UBP32-like protein [Mya arenaria]
MYGDDTFSMIHKDEMDRKIVTTEEQVPAALSELFAETDQVSYEHFRGWVYLHPDATTLTKWLLTEPIAFSLSLEETDISELEKKYWNLKAQSKSGKFDQETFKSFVSLFQAFDENRDNHIDFKEIACGVSAFCFKVFDTNHDGKLGEGELREMDWLSREERKKKKVGQVWYLISMQWWNTWIAYTSYKPIEENGAVPAIELASRRDSQDMKTTSLLSTCKNPTSCLGWDNDTVTMINVNKNNLLRETPLVGDSREVANHYSSNTFPRTSHSATNSPRKYRLSPEVDSVTRSPSASPKLKKRTLIPAKPGQIDNTPLVVPSPYKVITLTNEGGRLKRDVMMVDGKDFKFVIPSHAGELNPEVELYPVSVRLYRHQAPVQRPVQATSFTSMVTGIGGMAINTMSSFTNHTQQPRRFLAFTACYSRCHTIQQVYDFLCNKLRFTREDMRFLTVEQAVPTEPGATGLNNLGNTCFMNAAVQCVSNTEPLTQYFTKGLHLYEINRTNPLGMKGHIAQRYGDLVKDIWSGTTKTTAPLKLRWTIGKYAPRFNGFQQHDSQELLSFLLDGLHEDLNRVHDKPYVELKDSDGRPDETVAQEAWENHLLRNQSVIVDLFHGQLKSQVRCQACGHVSVRFDPFNYLSLPLPMESCIHIEIIVLRLDGSVPVKYGLRLNMDEKYKALKRELSSLASIPTGQILLVEIVGPVVKTLPHDNHKIRNQGVGGTLYAYELPPMEDVEPLTAEEEANPQVETRSPGGESRSTPSGEGKSSIGLSEIQRGVTSKRPSANGHISHLKTTPGMGSLNGSPASTPTHSRNNSSASLNTNSSVGLDSQSTPHKSVGDVFNGFVIAVHRKMKTRPSLFGTPIILPCDEKSTNQDLYAFIWRQVARIVSPLPPSEAKLSNHALDCDDSLGYEYPFTLKVVQKDGFTCAWCPWYSLECNTETFNFGSSFIAIDWEPTALHLRYQTTCERFFEEHKSVSESRARQSQPIDLDTCLRAFTKEEDLGEDELYYCSKCKKHCLASKKLDIWRLPPILIVNLKRFQFLNGRWVKSHKIVNFPLTDFDPSCYLVPRKHSLCNCGRLGNETMPGHHGDGPENTKVTDTEEKVVPNGNCDKESPESVSPARRKEDGENVENDSTTNENSSTTNNIGPSSENGLSTEDSMASTCPLSECETTSLDCLCNNNATGREQDDEKDSKYDLFAMSEVKESQMDTNAAYILFYKRRDLDPKSFMPEVEGKSPDTQEIDDEFESDFKRLCVIQ